MAGVDPQRAEGGGVHGHDPGFAEFRPRCSCSSGGPASVPKALLEAVARVGGAQVDTSPGRKVGEWVHRAPGRGRPQGRRGGPAAGWSTWVGDEPSRLLGLIDLLRSTYGPARSSRWPRSSRSWATTAACRRGTSPTPSTGATARDGARAAAAHDRPGRAPSVPGARHAALALRPDAPARRRGRRRREGGRRAARHEGLHVPGQEGAGPGPPARATTGSCGRSTCWPRPTSTCAAARPGRITSCSRCSWPAWPRCRGDLRSEQPPALSDPSLRQSSEVLWLTFLARRDLRRAAAFLWITPLRGGHVDALHGGLAGQLGGVRPRPGSTAARRSWCASSARCARPCCARCASWFWRLRLIWLLMLAMTSCYCSNRTRRG